MPVVIGPKPTPARAPKAQSAKRATARLRSDATIPAIAAAGVLALVLVIYLYFRFVSPIHTVALPDRVKPLPGFADQYPYNTKQWQEEYKKGNAMFLSGVPRIAVPGGPGGGPAPAASGPNTTGGAPN